MNIINKTFYCNDYKKKGQITKWGKILDITSSDEVAVFLSSNPLGIRIFNVKQSEIVAWIDNKDIFLKEKNR